MSSNNRTTNKSNVRMESVPTIVNVESTDNTLGVELNSLRNGKDGTTMNLIVPIGSTRAHTPRASARVEMTGRQARVLYETLRRHFETIQS